MWAFARCSVSLRAARAGGAQGGPDGECREGHILLAPLSDHPTGCSESQGTATRGHQTEQLSASRTFYIDELAGFEPVLRATHGVFNPEGWLPVTVKAGGPWVFTSRGPGAERVASDQPPAVPSGFARVGGQVCQDHASALVALAGGGGCTPHPATALCLSVCWAPAMRE